MERDINRREEDLHEIATSHTYHGQGRLAGAAAIVCFYSAMLLGPMSPCILLALYYWQCYVCFLMALAIFAWPFVFNVEQRAWMARFIMLISGWFKDGTTLAMERGVIHSYKARPSAGSLWCYHPHGTGFGFGFAANGGLRYKCNVPSRFLTEQMANLAPPERLRQISGLMAPFFFKVPAMRHLLLLSGTGTPATKMAMKCLFARKSDFGLLPGGSEEVLAYRSGRDRVYIKRRAGFIKYALQAGYRVFIAYTFGESDLYQSCPLFEGAQMWLLRHFGFIVPPLFWGNFPLLPCLPRHDVAVNTVVGSPLQLPRIEEPTKADVEHWHGRYIEELVALFDRHKSRFGYADRQLELL